MLKDMNGKEIKQDDKVLVAFPTGNSAYLRVGVVLDIKMGQRKTRDGLETVPVKVAMKWIHGFDGETTMQKVDSWRFHLLED